MSIPRRPTPAEYQQVSDRLTEEMTYDEMVNAGKLADDFLNAYSDSIAEARKRECNHAWPNTPSGDEPWPEEHCLKGCGATYELWGGTHR